MDIFFLKEKMGKNMNISKSKLFKASIGYTISNILIKGINFITLPIFTRLLSTKEYGLYSVFAAYESILSCIIGFALYASIKKANQDLENSIDEYVSTIVSFILISGGILLAISAIFSKAIYLQTDFNFFIISNLIILSVSGNIISVYNMRLSLNYSYSKYLICAVINSVGSVLLSITLIVSVFNSDRFRGKILGQTSIAAIVSIVIVIRFFVKARPANMYQNLSYGLRFSIPLIPHGISQIILAQCDRLMINAYINSSSAGIYSFAGNLNTILIVISDSIGTVWSTWFFDNMKKKTEKDIQKRASIFVVVFMVLTIGLIAISPELIRILGSKSYWISKYVAIPLIASGFLVFCYSIIVQGEYYTNNTKFVLLGTIIAACINITGNYFFIHNFGYIAAAYTTLFSYICYIILHFFISKKLLKFEIIRIRLLIMSIIGILAFGGMCLILIDNVLFRWIGMIFVEMGLILVTFRKYRNNIPEGE